MPEGAAREAGGADEPPDEHALAINARHATADTVQTNFERLIQWIYDTEPTAAVRPPPEPGRGRRQWLGRGLDRRGRGDLSAPPVARDHGQEAIDWTFQAGRRTK